MAKTTGKRAAKALDKLIERIFYQTSSGVQIPILQIGTIFDAGRAAYNPALSPEDNLGPMTEAIVAAVAAIRVN